MDTSFTRQFSCKKWTLFTFTVIASVSTLVLVITSCLAINALVDDDFNIRPRSQLKNVNHNSSSSYNLAFESNLTDNVSLATKFVSRYINSTTSGGPVLDRAKKTARTIIIVVGVLSILIQLLGMVGSLKEHYCMVVAYSVLCAIIGGVNIASSLEGSPGSWFSVVLYIFISCLAYSYARDIRRLRTAHLQTTTVTINPNIIYGVNGQSYPAHTYPANVPVQHFSHIPAPGGSGAMPVPYVEGQMQSNPIYGNTFAMAPGQTYANAPVNPYQPFPGQPYQVKQSETNFTNTADEERRTHGVSPPPYQFQNENN